MPDTDNGNGKYKALKALGRGIGLGLLVGVSTLVTHYWSKSDIDQHSQVTHQLIQENKENNTKRFDELQAQADRLEDANQKLSALNDDCNRANASLRHDMNELKRIIGIRINSDRGN